MPPGGSRCSVAHHGPVTLAVNPVFSRVQPSKHLMLSGGIEQAAPVDHCHRLAAAYRSPDVPRIATEQEVQLVSAVRLPNALSRGGTVDAVWAAALRANSRNPAMRRIDSGRPARFGTSGKPRLPSQRSFALLARHIDRGDWSCRHPNNRPTKLRSRNISCAALCPGAPVTPPPGCVPDPHIYRPDIGAR